jgi:hypothetical protein
LASNQALSLILYRIFASRSPTAALTAIALKAFLFAFLALTNHADFQLGKEAGQTGCLKKSRPPRRKPSAPLLRPQFMVTKTAHRPFSSAIDRAPEGASGY